MRNGMNIKSWNPVLNKVIEIKNEYKKRFGYISYYYKDGYTTESQLVLILVW